MGPPDPGTPPPEPPANQTTDSLTIKIEVPGTGSGGNDGDGGGGVGMLGEGGLSIQPSPPAGSDEEPQLLPLSWVWDLGSDAAGNPVGTLAFITDLTAANPLDLAKFSTRAGQPGGLAVTALPAGQTGWQVEAATAPSIRLQIVQVDAATVEVRRFKLGVDPAGTPGVVHRFELTTASGLPGIRHTEITGTSSQVQVDAGTAPATGGRTWRMAGADGTVRDGTESPWANDQQTTEETLSTNSGATFQQRTVTLRVKKPWGVEVVEERVYDSDAAGAVPVVTSHVFYESAADAASYGKLKWRSSTDGSWEKFIYLPGGETRSYRPWQDGPADPQSATAANSRTTLTSAGGQTVTESIAGQIVSITQSGSMAGMRHPHFWSVPMADPDPNNPDAPPQPMPEYYGSNLLDDYTYSYTLRQLPGQGGASLTSQRYVNNRTGRTDFIQDESGAVSVYEEFPASLVIAGANIAVTKRIRMQDLQFWAEGAPATTAPLQEVEYFDSKDRVLKKELLDTAGSVVSTTDYVYDGTTTRQTQVVQDGATVYDWQTSTDNDGNRVEIETDAQGGKTRTVTSPDGETVTRSKLAVDGTTALLTTTTSKNGLTETSTTTGGGLTRTSVVTRDAQGRTTQQVDEDGGTTNFEYQDGGRTVIEKDVANNVLKTTRQYLDGQLKSVEGAAVVAEYHDYVVAEGGLITETVRYGTAAGTLYRKRVSNGLGQLLQEIEPPQDGGAAEKVTQHAYDAQGRLETTQVTGMAPVQVLYDGLGRAAVQRVLLGAGGTESADDPLTTRTTGYETVGDALWEVSTTSQATDGSTAHDLITTQKRKLGTGPDTVQTATTPDGSVTTQSTVVDRATATVTTTTSSSRATRTATRIMINGLVQSETSLTATTATSYTYDGLERLSTVTTPEGVVHKTVYDDTTAGVARSRVKEQQLKPAGGSAFITQASHAYYPLGAAQEGRLQTLTNAENATTTYTYDAAGRVLTQTGTASYPLRYQYDTLGRLWKLHTYRAASPDLTQAGDVTTWVYDPASGKLTGKLDAANHGPSYTYTAGGLLHTRTWERGVVTTYDYDGAGRLTGVDYDDTTPDVMHGYDRAGRPTSTTDAAGEHTLAYDGSQLDTWTVGGTGKAWSGLSVDYGATAGRRSGREAALGTITVPAVSYAYATTSGALESVSTAGAGSTTVKATYRSTTATGWNEGVTYSVGASTKLSSTRTPDTRGRLDAVSWANGSNAVLSGHDYTLDAMNRRTAALRQDGSKWSYGYNLRGEVTSAAKEDAMHLPEPGKQYGFAFDGLGNRSSSTVSSLADNEVLRSTGYTANAVNQYEQITHPSPGWLVLRGRVNAQSSVTIDGNAPTLLSGGRWHHEQSVDNSAGAVRRVAEVTATRPDGGVNNVAVTARHKGALFIPPPVEVVTHDDDGNQTSNAHWSYTWDGENRMIAAEEQPNILTAPANSVVKRLRLECSYDAQGRRLTKRVLTAAGTSGSFILQQNVVFLYDGWNMIAEIDTTTSARLIRSYEWGLDLSGTMNGAGGVGGLLVLREHPASSNQSPASSHAPCYDGNGNVMELVNLATGGVSARYEYGAFGETISVDGDAIADTNPIRFSTKYLDVETGLYNYGYRLYDAPNGRWPSRDPINELGGANLYGMVANTPLNRVDYLGLFGGMDLGVPPDYPLTTDELQKERIESTLKSTLGGDALDDHLIHHLVYGGGLPLSIDVKQWNMQARIRETIMDWRKRHSPIEKAIRETCSNGWSEIERQVSTPINSKLLGSVELMLKGRFDCHFNGWIFHGTLELIDERVDFNMRTSKFPKSSNELYELAVRTTLTGVGKGLEVVGSIDPFWVKWVNPIIRITENGTCDQ
jgi:RHS repeat-associated protein